MSGCTSAILHLTLTQFNGPISARPFGDLPEHRHLGTFPSGSRAGRGAFADLQRKGKLYIADGGSETLLQTSRDLNAAPRAIVIHLMIDGGFWASVAHSAAKKWLGHASLICARLRSGLLSISAGRGLRGVHYLARALSLSNSLCPSYWRFLGVPSLLHDWDQVHWVSQWARTCGRSWESVVLNLELEGQNCGERACNKGP